MNESTLGQDYLAADIMGANGGQDPTPRELHIPLSDSERARLLRSGNTVTRITTSEAILHRIDAQVPTPQDEL